MIDKQDLLDMLELYEQGGTLKVCREKTGVQGSSIYKYLKGEVRYECWEEHIKKYPNGRVSNLKGRAGMRFHSKYS